MMKVFKRKQGAILFDKSVYTLITGILEFVDSIISKIQFRELHKSIPSNEKEFSSSLVIRY